MRLNKVLAAAGIASRRAADEFIVQGRVEINGKVVTALGTQVDLDTDDVRVDGRRLKAPPGRRYLLMYKPRGVVSTRSDPQRRETVIDVLAKSGITGYYFPVGRLDFDSEGLIVLTNDGTFADRVTHPRYQLPRTYEALVEGVPDERDLDRLRRGIPLDDTRTLPAEARVVRTMQTREGHQSLLVLTIREGRNRQVRRMCDAIAHPVAKLRRIRIGSIAMGHLRPGQVRELSAAEVASLLKPRPTRPARTGPAATRREGQTRARRPRARARP